jgi:hypothetical protein
MSQEEEDQVTKYFRETIIPIRDTTFEPHLNPVLQSIALENHQFEWGDFYGRLNTILDGAANNTDYYIAAVFILVNLIRSGENMNQGVVSMGLQYISRYLNKIIQLSGNNIASLNTIASIIEYIYKSIGIDTPNDKLLNTVFEQAAAALSQEITGIQAQAQAAEAARQQEQQQTNASSAAQVFRQPPSSPLTSYASGIGTHYTAEHAETAMRAVISTDSEYCRREVIRTMTAAASSPQHLDRLRDFLIECISGIREGSQFAGRIPVGVRMISSFRFRVNQGGIFGSNTTPVQIALTSFCRITFSDNTTVLGLLCSLEGRQVADPDRNREMIRRLVNFPSDEGNEATRPLAIALSIGSNSRCVDELVREGANVTSSDITKANNYGYRAEIIARMSQSNRRSVAASTNSASAVALFDSHNQQQGLMNLENTLPDPNDRRQLLQVAEQTFGQRFNDSFYTNAILFDMLYRSYTRQLSANDNNFRAYYTNNHPPSLDEQRIQLHDLQQQQQQESSESEEEVSDLDSLASSRVSSSSNIKKKAAVSIAKSAVVKNKPSSSPRRLSVTAAAASDDIPQAAIPQEVTEAAVRLGVVLTPGMTEGDLDNLVYTEDFLEKNPEEQGRIEHDHEIVKQYLEKKGGKRRTMKVKKHFRKTKKRIYKKGKKTRVRRNNKSKRVLKDKRRR